MELLWAVLHIAVGAPLVTFGLTWWAAARWARKNVPGGWSILGPIAVLTFLYKERRNLRGAVIAVSAALVVLVWAFVIATMPTVRWALTLAVPAGGYFGMLWWSASTYPTLDPFTAIRYHVTVGRHRQVLTDAVHASAGDTARVLSVDVVDGAVEATIVGPAGRSHDELVESLRDTLAESVMAQTGRAMRTVMVVGDGAKGRVKVRCLTVDPYEQTVRFDDLIGGAQ